MKVAFHFVSPLEDVYIFPELHSLFAYLHKERVTVQSQVTYGDILFNDSADSHTDLYDSWLENVGDAWGAYDPGNLRDLVEKSLLFAVVFDSIPKREAKIIHSFFSSMSHYCGGFEVNETCKLHWHLYTASMRPKLALDGKKLYLYYERLDQEDPELIFDESQWKALGFSPIEYVSLEGKGSVFDTTHSYEHSLAMSMWRRDAADLLSSLTDSIVFKLRDGAPLLGAKLHASLKAYHAATDSEGYAHSALSCRRLIEYVSDVLMPVEKAAHIQSTRDLGKEKFRNRLLAFAEAERKANTSIDLICASNTLLAEQLDKIANVQNKGLHDDIMREEARRCLLRTITMIDDILALRENPLPPKIIVDEKLAESFSALKNDET